MIILKCYDREELLRNSFKITKRFQNALESKSLTLDVKKSEAVLIRAPRDDRKETSVMLGKMEIQVSDSMKYLGFTIGKNLSMTQHVKNVCEKARKVTQSYRCLMSNVKSPSFYKKLLIINAILSIIMYGVSIWSKAFKLKKNVN